MSVLDGVPAASATADSGVPVSHEVALQRATEWANQYAAQPTNRVQNSLASQNGQNGGGLRPHIGEVASGDPVTGFDVAFDLAVT